MKKKNSIKRTLALTLAALLIFTMLPLTAAAEDAVVVEPIGIMPLTTPVFNIGTATWSDGAPVANSHNTTWNGTFLFIQNGADIGITGTSNAARHIVVDDNATAIITISDLTISLFAQPPLQLNGGSNLTLNIEGNNTLTAGSGHNAGIRVYPDATLTIEGTTGSLTATGANAGAGIGGNGNIGGAGSNNGTVIINGGTITATGGNTSGAGIGGGRGDPPLGGSGGTIIINGGTVNATGGAGSGATAGGAGLGGGGNGGAGGNITINAPAVVNATGTWNSAGIGGGGGGDSGTININGGTVTAGSQFGPSIGAGIDGAGGGGTTGSITIGAGAVMTHVVSTSEQLTSALTTIGNGTATIQLGASFTHNALITIPANANITLTSDSTVRMLTRGASGQFFLLSGGTTLTFENIVLDGDSGSFPATAFNSLVSTGGGTLVMNSGTTLQNNSNNSNGGAVNIGSNGTFIMNGGTISGNHSNQQGGGVFVHANGASFTMNGGTISNNTAVGIGGGVLVDSGFGANDITIGGNANITGNTISGNPNNVWLENNRFITLSTTNAPQSGMNVGVTKTANNGVIVQSGATPANITANHFTADATGYGIFHNNGQLRIMPTTAGATRTISFNANNGTGTMYPDTVLNGENYTIKANAFTRTGWIFTGWNTAANGTGTAHAAGATINNVNADITLFAQWEQTITTLAIGGVTVPAAGAAPAATVTGGGAQWNATIAWFNNTTNAPAGANFTANTAYRAEITINPQTGWTLTGVANPGFGVTGADTITRSTNVVTAVFTSTGVAPIPTAAITVTAPALGATPNTTATVVTGNFTAGAVAWTPNHSPFQGGTQYTATVTLSAATGHTFTGLTTATINGNTATVTNNTGAAVTLSFQFPSTTDAPITIAAITVTAPVTNAIPNTTAGGTGNFTMSAVTWTPNNNPFTGATQYTATVTLTASGGHTFTGLTTATINGNNATVTSNTGAAVTLSFQFPATFMAVTNITGVDTSAITAGQTRALSGTVVPSNATNQTIAWSIHDAGTTGASITGGNVLNVPTAGTVVVRATITNGLTPTSNYIQDFTITVNAAFVAVTDITGVNTSAMTAGTTRNLSGTVVPNDATNQSIAWSIHDAGTTGASITGGNTLNVPTDGTVVVRATIANGEAVGTAYTQDFTITVNVAQINSAAITVTAPSTGAAPSPTATGTGNFTVGGVTWTPANATFTGGTQYTATVTLTANAGHTFTGIPAANVTINGQAATVVSNNGNTLTLSRQFTATAAASITSAAIAVTAPATGVAPNPTATGTGDFTVGAVSWTPNNDPFSGGTQYTATVTLDADSGHTFAGIPAANVTINGNTATIVSNAGTSLTLSFQFASTTLAPIPVAAVNVTAPVTGVAPSATATGTGNFAMGAVSWTPANTPFTGGTQYTAEVTLTASAGHTFAGIPAGSVTINGNAATIVGTPGATLTLSYEFAATTVLTAPIISPTTVSDGTVGTLYNQTFTFVGSPTPVWLAPTGTLPPGLTFNMATGTLSGTPSQDGVFTFDVRAENAAGIGTQSITLTINLAPTAPGAPENLIAIPGNGQVALGWDAPASDGGSAILRYEVQVDGGAWEDVGLVTSHIVTGLTNGNTFTFNVRAVNAIGNGAEASETATPVTVPTAPENFTATAGNGQAALSWDAPASNGGSAILRYEVQVGGGAWTDVGLATTHTATGLANNTAVTFHVRAVNVVGNGAAATATATPTGGGGGGGGGGTPIPVITITSQPADAIVTQGSIDSNLYVAATVTQGATLSFRWYRASDPNRADASEFANSTSATFPKPTDLAPGTHYFYVVVSATGGAAAVLADVAVVTVRAEGDGPVDGFPFIDVPEGHWARGYVEFVWEEGIMNGVSDTLFAPNVTLSRAMAATILWRTAGEPAASGGVGFSDVADGRWYSEAIAWARENGIILGVGGNRFAPGVDVTREELAALMYRYTVFTEGNTDVPDGFDLSHFQDRDQVSGWAERYMYWANYNGLITGVNSTTLSPQGDATRAQSAAIIYRFVQVFG